MKTWLKAFALCLGVGCAIYGVPMIFLSWFTMAEDSFYPNIAKFTLGSWWYWAGALFFSAGASSLAKIIITEGKR